MWGIQHFFLPSQLFWKKVNFVQELSLSPSPSTYTHTHTHCHFIKKFFCKKNLFEQKCKTFYFKQLKQNISWINWGRFVWTKRLGQIKKTEFLTLNGNISSVWNVEGLDLCHTYNTHAYMPTNFCTIGFKWCWHEQVKFNTDLLTHTT